MLPEARRRRTKAPDQRVRTFDKRAGTGEKKGCKRMAETGCVFDVAVPDGPARTPEQVMRPDPGPARRTGPGRRTAGTPATSPPAATSPSARSSTRPTAATLVTCRTWIALVDGDNYQLGLIQAAAAARGITLAIVIDFIHVLEYLWKAAWCFHPPRRPGHGRLGDRAGPGHPARPHRRRHRPDRAARRRAPAQARRRARQDHPQDPALPGQQAGLHGLPAGPGERLADRHRRHRGSLPAPRRRTGWFSAVGIMWPSVP